MLGHDQRELLAKLVEAERNVAQGERQYFLTTTAAGVNGLMVLHPGLPPQGLIIFGGDLDALRSAGLISTASSYGRSESFHVTQEGFDAYQKFKLEAGLPTSRVQETVKDYLDAETFRECYGAAYEKWAQAEQLLWKSDSQDSRTMIGHLAREAMQEFADALAKRYCVACESADKTKTVARIRATLSARLVISGDTEREFLNALIGYWGTVADLTQRQEHGAQREGTDLVWFDSRRLVFQTAIVMFEVAAALSRSNRSA